MRKIDARIFEEISTTYQYKKFLGKGGQGSTFLLTRKEDKQPFVLKQLRFQNRTKPRVRMYIETKNLEVLSSLGALVPKVIYSNTDKYEDKNIPLYFIMEFIDGESFKDLIIRKGPMNVEESIEIIESLIFTLEIAHEYNILHRDIKPQNLMFNSKNQAYFLDYGLSFNEDLNLDISPSGEKIDIRFLSLPESKLSDGDRRDKRTDLTYLAGIFYFLLTGNEPEELRNSNNVPPHRRNRKRFEKICKNQIHERKLLSFFDKAFQIDINARFQNIEAFKESLSQLKPDAINVAEDLSSISDEAFKELLNKNPSLSLDEYSNQLRHLTNIHEIELRKINNEISPYFIEGIHSLMSINIKSPEYTVLPRTLTIFTLELYTEDNWWLETVNYVFGQCICFHENEFKLMEYSSVYGRKKGLFKITHGLFGRRWRKKEAVEWNEVVNFTLEYPVSKEFVINQLKNSVAHGIQRLEKYY